MNAVEKDLKSEMHKRESLSYQLKELQFSINKQINEIQKQTTNRLNEFRKALKHSELFENERKLRNRKELHFLEKGHLLNKKKFQSLKDRNLQMQRTIFDCQPLQLEFHQDHSAEFKEEEYL